MPPKIKNSLLSKEDEELWSQIKDSATPILRTEKVTFTRPSSTIIVNIGSSFSHLGPTHHSNKGNHELKLGAKAGVNNTTRRKMDKGEFSIDRALDLHGMSAGQALSAFELVLNQAYIKQERLLLVITGKGRTNKEYSGVLRAELLKWVNLPHFANKIVRVSQATGSHGGGGAFYILLHRVRA